MEAASSDYRVVAKVEDLPEGEGRCFKVDGRSVAVFQLEGRFYAVEDFCPHQGSPLHDGDLSVENGEPIVACRYHGWRFSLQSGCWLSARKTKTGIAAYPVRVVDGRIEIKIES